MSIISPLLLSLTYPRTRMIDYYCRTSVHGCHWCSSHGVERYHPHHGHQCIHPPTGPDDAGARSLSGGAGAYLSSQSVSARGEGDLLINPYSYSNHTSTRAHMFIKIKSFWTTDNLIAIIPSQLHRDPHLSNFALPSPLLSHAS